LSDVINTGGVPPDQKRRLELTAGDRKLSFDAVITDVAVAAEAGDVMRAAVSFVVSGPLVEASLGGS
jgi:hypothetical protein